MEAKKAHRQSRAPWLNPAASNKPNFSNLHDHPPLPKLALPKHLKALNSNANNPYNTASSSKPNRSHARSFSIASVKDAPVIPQPTPRDSSLHASTASSTSSASPAQDISAQYDSLKAQKDSITASIAHNVNQNQKNILSLTNGLNTTLVELASLRSTSRELFTVIDTFTESARAHSAESTNNSSNAPRNRSSVIAVEKMWSSHMQSLFKHVDGALKLVPLVPGRHVLAESGRWLEINAGTWKPMHPAHIFVLNDMLLLATKKPGADRAHRSKLQATHCFRLDKVRVTQLHPPSADSSTYYISVVAEGLSFAYSTDRMDHLYKVIDAYKRGVSQLLHQNRIDASQAQFSSLADETRDGKRQLRDTVRSSLNSNHGSPILNEFGNKRLLGEVSQRYGHQRNRLGDGMLHDISARVHSRKRSHDFSPPNSSGNNTSGSLFAKLKTMEDKLDDVDIVLAHNDVAQSVALLTQIEQKLKALDVTGGAGTNKNSNNSDDAADEAKLLIDVIRLKISNRQRLVQDHLRFEMHHRIDTLTPEAVAETFACFAAFGELPQGVSAYLALASLLLQAQVGRLMVGAHGSTQLNVVAYLSALLVVYVAHLKRTVKVYLHLIKAISANGDAVLTDSSGLIRWCVNEAHRLVTQVYKHSSGTFITAHGVSHDTGRARLTVKDPVLFHQFRSVLTAQLDELKKVGVNVDYMFHDILALL